MLKDFLKHCLNIRGLEFPDGRPLYAYRLELDEFKSLRLALLNSSRHSFSWAAGLVLFAAEWWRREYDGGQWSWSPIFNRVGVEQISPQERSELIKDGLDYWQRDLRTTDQGNAYLLSIVIEGGLPLNRLQKEKGGNHKLLYLLRSSINQLISKKHLGLNGLQVIRSKISSFPTIYQREEVQEVIAEIVDACVKLRQQYALADKEDAITWLNQNVPKWQDTFPLNIGEDSGKILLEEIVLEASKAEASGGRFEIQRFLVDVGNCKYRLDTKVLGPKIQILAEDLESFGSFDPKSTMAISVVSKSQKLPAFSLQQISREPLKYRVRNLGLSLEASVVSSELQLVLEDSRTGEVLGQATEFGGHELDENLAWVFIKSEAANALYIGQGNVCVRQEECFIVIPLDSTMDIGTGYKEVGYIDADKKVYYGAGVFKSSCKNITSFVRSGQPATSAIEYVLEGRKLSWPSSPRQAFLGFPQVFEYHLDGTRRQIPKKEIMWRYTNGLSDYKLLTNTPPPGIVDLAITTSDGSLKRKIVNLKEDARIDFNASKSSKLGRYEFIGFGLADFHLNPERNTLVQPVASEGADQLTLRYLEDTPPRDIVVDVQWPHQTEVLSLTLPFPSVGAQFFLGEKPLSDGEQVFLNRLHGIHARVFGEISEFGLNIAISAFLTDEHSVLFYKSLPSIKGYSEIRLIDYFDDLTRLFSASDELDATITLELEGNGTTLSRIFIHRYEALIESVAEGTVELKSLSQRAFHLEDIEKTELLALPVWLPERSPVLLKPITSEGTYTSCWKSEHQLFSGPWFFYPAEGSSLTVRPTLIPVKNNLAVSRATGELGKCSLLEKEADRHSCFISELKGMEKNAESPGWRFLTNLLRRLGHLPLSSSDLLVAMIDRPDTMARVPLLLDLPDFDYGRFETELPFVWQRVFLKSWLSALTSLNCTELSEELKRFRLQKKVEAISSMIPQAASAILKEAILQDASGVTTQLPLSLYLGQLREEAQKLFIDVGNDRWPEIEKDFNSILSNFSSGLEELIQVVLSYCNDNETRYRKSVLLLPVLVGVSWFKGESRLFRSPMFIRDFHLVRAFHPVWFDEAVDLSVIYCFLKYKRGELDVPSLEVSASFGAIN